MTGYHNPISETIAPSTSQRTKNPRIGIEYALGGLNYAGRNNYGLHWEISFCVIVSAVLYCVQCSLRCTPQDIQSWGCQQRRGWGGRRRRWRWQQQWVMVVIVLLYTLSHSAISVLKIMSPSNEVRPPFIIYHFLPQPRSARRCMPRRCF